MLARRFTIISRSVFIFAILAFIAAFCLALQTGCKTLEDIIPPAPDISTTTTTTQPATPLPTPDPSVPSDPSAYVSLWPSEVPVKDTISKGAEISGVNFGGCDIRFLANDPDREWRFISEPKGSYSINKDAAGNYVVTGSDFEREGKHLRYVGFRAAKSSSTLLTDNPATILPSQWKQGGNNTGRFYWQVVR